MAHIAAYVYRVTLSALVTLKLYSYSLWNKTLHNQLIMTIY